MKFIKTLIAIFISIIIVNNAFAENTNLSIIDIDSSNSNLIKIFFDKEIESSNLNIDWTIKVFKDLKYNNIVKELENNRTISINLKDNLEKNTSYSFLSIYWTEWNIDFKIYDIIDWLKVIWGPTSWIKELNIIDSNTIKIIFIKDIIWNSIDIKILEEYKTKWLSIDKDNNKKINVNLLNNLSKNSNYLLMLFTFSNYEKVEFIINNPIFDFLTKDSLEKAKIIEIEEIKKEERIWYVAFNSAETPDTWAETWILLLATFLLSNFLYFRKKFTK